jgi:hypothetical protein
MKQSQHSRLQPSEQGRTQHKPRKPVPSGMAIGRAPQTESFSVTDGRVTIGTVKHYGDARNGRWVAYDAHWRPLGSYSTMEAAIAALPAPKVRP